MSKIQLSIDNIKIAVEENTTILNAAAAAGIYIPRLCSHPDLKPFGSVELSEFIYQGETRIDNDPGATIDTIKGCGVCAVMNENTGAFMPSCKMIVEESMVISTNNEQVILKRRENLSKILATHPHSCLTCAQREGCIPMTDVCSGNVVINERCCALLGKCEIQKIAEYVGVAPETPRYRFAGLPIVTENPLFKFDYNLCIGCGRCVRMCQQVKGVYALGAVIKDGRLKVGTVNGPNLMAAECKFCGSCVEVCPTGAIMDKKSPRLKELYDLVPCRAGCPGDVNIPQYLRLVAQGRVLDAADIIASKLTFPGVLGKACFHPCETNCRRNEIAAREAGDSDSLNIRWIKDYAISNSSLMNHRRLFDDTGKKVAVIGAGPAGLTAAYFLTLKGHSVTVYEKESDIGGMLRYGIPRYRLSEEVLNKDLERIRNVGINFLTNHCLGKDFTIESLIENGADAVFISIGLSKSKAIPAIIDEKASVKYGVEFLNDLAKNKLSPDYYKDKSVIVIGGGNVAVDAARSALRLEAAKVELICLEQPGEMPAYPNELKEAKAEGIQIRNGWGVIEIKNSDNQTEIKLKKCVSVFDGDGRFSPTFDESVKDIAAATEVIICIGQEPGNEFTSDARISRLLNKGIITADKESHVTAIKGIYAGGDIVSGPASIIEAVGAGRKAAIAIDLKLGGDGIIDDESQLNQNYDMRLGRNEGFNRQERLESVMSEPAERRLCFMPIENTYSEGEAVQEASRCLQCDLRLRISHNPHPPEKFLIFCSEAVAAIPEQPGVVQLLNSDKEIITIKGSENIRDTLLEMLDGGKDAPYFIFEEDPMFTKRESELLQQYLQKYGKLPDSGDDLDDLF